jgi:DNA-binding response OmpR family regulator
VTLTTFDMDEYDYEAFRAGASGFLVKDVPSRQLVAGIRSVTRETQLQDRSDTDSRRRLRRVGGGSNDQEEPRGCSFGFLTLEQMWASMLDELTTSPPASQMGRLAQLLKAAGLTAPEVVAPPSPPVPGSDAAIANDLDEEP